MKTQIYKLDGSKKGEMELPKFFSETIREDIVAKVIESKKSMQPFAPSPVAGKQHSASGIFRHLRKVWKSAYGRGQSRIPRKITMRRGSQFNTIGAEISSTRGGRRSHPPKVLQFLNQNKINKKEDRLAFKSAIAATADPKMIKKKYSSLKDKEIPRVPFIIDSLNKVKTRDLVLGLKKILNELFEIAMKKKSIRAGRGTLRGRKYKSNAGVLIVIGKDESLNNKGFDVVSAENLGIADLAKGGVGRLTIYTESAIKELEKRLQ